MSDASAGPCQTHSAPRDFEFALAGCQNGGTRLALPQSCKTPR